MGVCQRMSVCLSVGAETENYGPEIDVIFHEYALR